MKADSKLALEDAQAEAQRVYEQADTDAVIELAESENCVLCADETDIREKDCYGYTDIASAMPESRESNVCGLKSGTVLPLALPACKRCRNNFYVVQFLPTAISTILVALALFLLSREGTKAKLSSMNIPVPYQMRGFCLFVIILALAMLLCAGLRRSLASKLGKKTHFHVFKLEKLLPLKEKGWFKLYENKHCSQVVFSNNAPSYNTVDDEKEHCECCGGQGCDEE